MLGSDLGHLEINFMDVLLYNGVAKELVVLSEVDIVPRLKVNLPISYPVESQIKRPQVLNRDAQIFHFRHVLFNWIRP